MRKLLRIAEISFLAVAVGSALIALVSIGAGPLFRASAGSVALLSGIGVYLLHRAIRRSDASAHNAVVVDPPIPVTISYTWKGLLLPIFSGLIYLPSGYLLLIGDRLAAGVVLVILGILCLLWLLKSVSRIGQPALVISEMGIFAARYGSIPWKEIDQADVIPIKTRYGTHNQLNLSLYKIKTYHDRQPQLIRFTRWLELPSERNRLRISVEHLSHHPEYIDAAIKKARGRFASAIGISLVTGDLSIDRRLSEITKALGSLDPDDDINRIRSVHANVEKLHRESNDELAEMRDMHSRELLLILLVLAAILIGWLAIKLLAR